MKALISIIIFGIVIITIAAFSDANQAYTWSYKITIAFETPEGLKTGSAVRKVIARDNRNLNPDTKQLAHKVIGEAVVIDLGKRGVFFALLEDDAHEYVYKTFPYASEDALDTIQHYSNLPPSAPAPLPMWNWPRFVYFKDIADPKSVEYVHAIGADNPLLPFSQRKPIVKIDRLEDVFGKGVRLKSVEIEMTSEPVVPLIGKQLSWLEGLRGGYLDGATIGGGPDLSNILIGGYFKAGE